MTRSPKALNITRNFREFATQKDFTQCIKNIVYVLLNLFVLLFCFHLYIIDDSNFVGVYLIAVRYNRLTWEDTKNQSLRELSFVYYK